MHVWCRLVLLLSLNCDHVAACDTWYLETRKSVATTGALGGHGNKIILRHRVKIGRWPIASLHLYDYPHWLSTFYWFGEKYFLALSS
jgi:hypothetical protein